MTAGRLAPRLSADESWRGGWAFVAALLTESGAAVPVTEGVVGSWLVAVQHQGPSRRDPFVDRLRESPYLDTLLPAVFEIDGLGAHLNLTVWDLISDRWTGEPAFPAAVAQLVAEGRLDRKTILAATVDRLVRGDRPAWLRPFALLHDALAPTVDELAGHALDYAQLLPAAPSAIAGIAQRALRAVDDAGRLDLDTLLDASRPTLVRKEKVLVKAQLSWLDKVARRSPDRAVEILETVAAAFEHPALEIQERALTLIEKRGAGLDLSPLAATTADLGGDLPARAARLFGPAPGSPDAFAGLPVAGSAGAAGLAAAAGPFDTAELLSAGSSGTDADASEAAALIAAAGSSGGGAVSAVAEPFLVAGAAGPAAMPAPIASVAELAEEIVGLLHEETSVRWERVLEGLITLRSATDLSPLRHLLNQHDDAFREERWRPRHHALGTAIRGLLKPATLLDRAGKGPWLQMLRAVRARFHSPAEQPQLNGSPERLLTLRIVEAAVLLPTTPVGFPVAMPTHIDGNLDAGALVERLRRAEAEGWEPWPLDFEQALLRLPRGTSPSVADGLTSPAGRRLVEWLTGGGLPDPVGSMLQQRRAESRSYHVSPPPELGRRVVNLVPARPGMLSVEDQLVTLTRRSTIYYDSDHWVLHPDILSAALPHHREVSAAWALPGLAALADQDERGGSTLLPLLAEANGPFGPAMSLAVAYVLAARHESDRVAAVDAFLTLTARETSAPPHPEMSEPAKPSAGAPSTPGAVEPSTTNTSTPSTPETEVPAPPEVSQPARSGTDAPAALGNRDAVYRVDGEVGEIDLGIRGGFGAGTSVGVGVGVGVGKDLGELAARGMIKLNRVVLSLGDAHRAGASAAVWEVVAVAVPLLLPVAPRGLPDLLELASLVAGVTGARGEVAGLAEAGARKGNTRLLQESRRLLSVLSA